MGYALDTVETRGTPDSLWKQRGRWQPISELIFQAGSETSFQRIFKPQDRPAAPRLSRLIPLKRRRLKRHRLGLRPGDQSGREVVVNSIAPRGPRNTIAHAITARGIKTIGKGGGF